MCNFVDLITGIALASAHGARRSGGRSAQEAATSPVKIYRGHQRNSGITHRQVGGNCSRVDEDQAGVGPLLESGKARDEQSHPAEHIPDTDDGREVARVAQVLHDPDEGWQAQGAHHSSHPTLEGEEHGDDPVGDGAASGAVGGVGEFRHEKCHIDLVSFVTTMT
jgi:hypothetical protein